MVSGGPDESSAGAAIDPWGHLGSTSFILRLLRAFTLGGPLFIPVGLSEISTQDSGEALNCSSTDSCPGNPPTTSLSTPHRVLPRGDHSPICRGGGAARAQG